MSGPWRDWPEGLPPPPPRPEPQAVLDSFDEAQREHLFEVMRTYLRGSRHWPLAPVLGMKVGACRHSTTRGRTTIVAGCDVALLAAATLKGIGWPVSW